MRVVVKEREREGREWRDERGNGKREKGGGGGGVENVANGKLCVMQVGRHLHSSCVWSSQAKRSPNPFITDLLSNDKRTNNHL